MTLDEQVAVLTAIQKRAKELLDELRPEMNAKAIEDYIDRGISKREVRVAGRKVADLIVPLSAERYDLDPDRKAEFREFADLHGLTVRKPKVKEGCEHEAMRFLQAERPDLVSESVEMMPGWQKILAPDGTGAKVGGTDYVVPGIIHVPPEPKSPTLRGLDWREVSDAAKELPGGLAGLLEG